MSRKRSYSGAPYRPGPVSTMAPVAAGIRNRNAARGVLFTLEFCVCFPSMNDLLDNRPHVVASYAKGPLSYRVKRYRERAEELRTIAADLASEQCRETFIRLAKSYEQMALTVNGERPEIEPLLR